MPRQYNKKKDKWSDLDQDFKDTAAGLNEAELRDRIAKTSLDQCALIEAKEADFDFKEKKEAAKEAGAIYREGTKRNKLVIDYLRSMLDAKGKDTGSSGQE